MSDEKHYVTTGELALKLQAMRWEMRCLIALSCLTNLGLAYKLNVPVVSQGVAAVINTLT